MDDVALHDLTAAYALDALDESDAASYEEHLATCARCRDELASFAGATEALAYAAEPKSPPLELRERILEVARSERSNVVPLRPRAAAFKGGRATAAAALVAACAAIALAVWNVSLHDRLSNDRSALRAVPLQGVAGSVVIGAGGRSELVAVGLHRIPAGKTYEAWVIEDGGTTARPAGLFQAHTGTTVVRLTRPVPKGARVGVTVEPRPGSPQPTSKPLVLSAPV